MLWARPFPSTFQFLPSTCNFDSRQAKTQFSVIFKFLVNSKRTYKGGRLWLLMAMARVVKRVLNLRGNWIGWFANEFHWKSQVTLAVKRKNIESFSTHYTTHTFKAEIQVMVCFIPTGIVRKWKGKWSFPPIHAYLRRHDEEKLKQLPGYRGWPFLIDWQKTMAICHHPWVQRKVSPDKETEIKKSSWEKQKQVKIFDIYYIFNCKVKG